MSSIDKIQEQIKLDRQTRGLRTDVSYLASSIGSLAATWTATQSGDAALELMEESAARLVSYIKKLRELRDSQ